MNTATLARSARAAPGFPLTVAQVVLLVLLGILFWFVAAMLLNWLAPMGALDGAMQALTYALVVPATVPFILLTMRLAQLSRQTVAIGGSVVTMSALLTDGLIFGWAPWIYSMDPELAVKCSGAVLWGAGVGLAISLVLTRTNPRP